MNHSIDKWQQNKPKCIQSSLCGTQRCDIWHFLSYRYSLPGLPFFTLSPSLSCALHPLSPTESGWPGMSSPTDGSASSQRGAVCRTRLSASSSVRIYRHFWKPLVSKTDGWLLPVTQGKVHERGGRNQLTGSDTLLCLLHLATSAIILSLKRSVNNLIINGKEEIRKRSSAPVIPVFMKIAGLNFRNKIKKKKQPSTT